MEHLQNLLYWTLIKRIKDKQLRHRIFQTSLRGIQKAIEEKAKELGAPVIYVDPNFQTMPTTQYSNNLH